MSQVTVLYIITSAQRSQFLRYTATYRMPTAAAMVKGAIIPKIILFIDAFIDSGPAIIIKGTYTQFEESPNDNVRPGFLRNGKAGESFVSKDQKNEAAVPSSGFVL